MSNSSMYQQTTTNDNKFNKFPLPLSNNSKTNSDTRRGSRRHLKRGRKRNRRNRPGNNNKSTRTLHPTNRTKKLYLSNKCTLTTEAQEFLPLPNRTKSTWNNTKYRTQRKRQSPRKSPNLQQYKLQRGQNNPPHRLRDHRH